MNITLTTPNHTYTFAPEVKVITIGRKCEEVWNAVAIDCESISEFQCQIQYADGKWIIRNGQIRTECPKGLRSSKIVPCSFCMGRCVNLRAGNPKYFWRYPETATLLSNNAIPGEGMALKESDSISCGNGCDIAVSFN